MRYPALVALVLVLTGCGGGYAPVYDQSLGARAVVSVGRDEYRVQSGDTLIGIAFKLGVDYRELQRINNIRDRNLIYAGQVLKTKSSSTSADRAGTSVKKESQRSAPIKPEEAKKVAKSAPSKTKVQPVVSNIPWGWPHNGKILAGYSPAEGGNKGLDISGKIGDPVLAAADGQVVYAGSGLLGYGNLVIISHNQEYLSAYAHNSRILVRENQKVKLGEPVAEIGNTGASVPMLHFEVRRDGRPVDPLRYLPKR